MKKNQKSFQNHQVIMISAQIPGVVWFIQLVINILKFLFPKRKLLLIPILFLSIHLIAFGQNPTVNVTKDPIIKPIAKEILAKINANQQFVNINLFEKAINRSEYQLLKTDVDSFVLLSVNKNELTKLLIDGPQFIKLKIPNSKGNSDELFLMKHTVTTSDFSIKLSSGEILPVNSDNGLHYWGIINNQPNSSVAISFFLDDIMGLITSIKGNQTIGKMKNSHNYIYYNEKYLKIKNNFICGNNENAEGLSPINQNINRTIQNTSTQNTVKFYIEANYDIYTDKGSVSATTNYITGLFNQTQLLFNNDGINVALNQILVWNTPSPYSGSTSSGWLNSFQNYTGSINGDVGILLKYSNTLGGIAATINGLCTSNNLKKCFCGIDGYYQNIPTYSWTTMVITHETGHLLGSQHSHNCSWNNNNTAIDGCGPTYGTNQNPPVNYEGNCYGAPIPSSGGTMMSYCHLGTVGINFNNGFGPQPASRIINTVNNASCLLTVTCTDAFESNNSSSTATNVFASPLNSGNSNYTLQGNIGWAGDQDWWKINIGYSGTITFNLSNLPFQIDIELYGPGGLSQWIAGSYNSGTSNQQIVYNYTGNSTTIYLKVYPHNPSNYTTASCYNLQFLWVPTVVNHNITTSSLPANGGTTSGGGSYPNNQSCTATAFANPGFTFSYWTENGNIVSYNSNYTFTVSGNRSLVANFTPTVVNYTITTSSLPANGGTTNGGGYFPNGQNCTVSATSNSNFSFQYWTENGNIVSNNSSYSFSVSGNRNLVANFTPTVVNYNIITSSLPTNGGSTNGGGSFPNGQSCTATAFANPGFTFSYWTENGNIVSYNSNYTFTVSGNRSLVANFTNIINITENTLLGSDSSIVIYPNPAKNELMILINNSINQRKAMIYNAAGKIFIVKYFTHNTNKLDISDLNKGIYFLSIESYNTIRIFKFIKE